MIIILNGTSSSGKSSLVKGIQDRSGKLFLELGLDKFIFMLPRRYWSTALWKDVMGEADRAGPTGHDLVGWMYASAKALHGQGANILMDHVLIEQKWKEDLRLFSDEDEVYLVKVGCPLDLLEARERQRKDRTLGQARKQYDLVHANLEYDFDVDTSRETPESGAQKILEHVSAHPSRGIFVAGR